MTRRPRPHSDLRALGVIRAQEQEQVRYWLSRFRGLPEHEKVEVMVELLRKSLAEQDGVDVVRGVVTHGHLLDILETARIRLKRTKVITNPLLSKLPVGSTFWRAGKRYQVTAPPKPWGQDTLIPVRSLSGSGTLPSFLNVHKTKFGSVLDNPIRHTPQGYYWGSRGPFQTRDKAVSVARAAYSSGYKGNPTSKVERKLPGGYVLKEGKIVSPLSGRFLSPRDFKFSEANLLAQIVSSAGYTAERMEKGISPSEELKVMGLITSVLRRNPTKLTSSMTPTMMRRWFKSLTPVQQERVREQVILRAETARFMGHGYSEALAREVRR